MSEVSLKRFYFALFDDGLYFKNFEIGVNRFFNSNSSIISATNLIQLDNQSISVNISYIIEIQLRLPMLDILFDFEQKFPCMSKIIFALLS